MSNSGRNLHGMKATIVVVVVSAALMGCAVSYQPLCRQECGGGDLTADTPTRNQEVF